MTKIGYARVSSIDQNLERQIAALRPEGCDKIFRKKASGKSMRNRRELVRAIDALPTKGRPACLWRLWVYQTWPNTTSGHGLNSSLGV